VDEPLDDLLEALGRGDEEALAQAFAASAPYLRVVVRSRLSGGMRAKFDSVDVVQSVWADLVRGFRGGRWRFGDGRQLRAFLVRAVRNRFLNRVRRHRRAVERERPLAEGPAAEVASPVARPSEAAQAGELWERLLAVCPPAHRRLLELKRQGLSLEELAAQTGLHPSSVRRILYTLAREVAAQSPGGRSAARPEAEGPAGPDEGSPHGSV
jgi:RNA polymerase sigma factor (sigma-70 family)